MALACRDELVRHGVEVRMSRTKDANDTLQQEIAECNSFNPDLAVDIHNNAGGGDGFECYYHVGGGWSKTLALNIEAEVKKIGQNSRGCKTKVGSGGRDYFGFIRETKCPAVICEGVFVDSEKDAAQADTTAEQKAFGVAYAKGILKTLGIAYKAPAAAKRPAAAASSGKTYKVQVGAYKDKANAEAQLAKLKKAGFDAVIVTG
jgi:N-acetylmuramoyl-L-alanine amidase